MSSVKPIFEIRNLDVLYGRNSAVENLSLSVSQGDALGLLGANGAGKSSTLKVLVGMRAPSRGTVTVFGEKPGRTSVLRRLGFAPEEATPPERFTAREYLEFLANYRIARKSERRSECQTLLQEFDLAPDKKVRDYSKGMKRRLVLAQAFLGNPPLLILDEPLNGLDPLVIVQLRQRLEKYRSCGGTLIFSSHILAEVEKTCSRIAILKQGALVLDESLPRVLQKHASVEAAFEYAVGPGEKT